VPFALGTDTAGSGRVPAGLCNISGLKPTKGWLSTHGVLPACRSLDCVSVFALSPEDSWEVAALLYEGPWVAERYATLRTFFAKHAREVHPVTRRIVGLKPTPGRVSTVGVLPACRSLDCVSVFAQTVDDAAAVLACIEGVRHRTVGRARADQAGGELVEVGLADDDGAGIDQALHHRRVGSGGAAGEARAAGGGGQAGDVDVVLHSERHAEQRQAFEGGGALLAQACVAGIGGREQLRVREAADPRAGSAPGSVVQGPRHQRPHRLRAVAEAASDVRERARGAAHGGCIVLVHAILYARSESA